MGHFMNFFIDNLVYFWLIVSILFLIMEMGSPGLFFFLSFFFGGLVAAGATFFVDSLSSQMALFFVGTTAALVVLRYYIIPLLAKGRSHERTNVYAMQGKQGFVIKIITAENPGLVRINGEMWVAKVIHGQSIQEGILVEVVDVRGAHVVVKKV